MAELPHMPLATDAYLGDTRHLTTLEHGAYLLLLITAWRCRGRPQLPDDDKLLARCAGVDPRTWQRIRPTVMAFWTLGADGFWTQAKQLRVRDVVNKNAENQRNKAAKRWSRKALENNNVGDAAAYAQHMPDECQPNPNPNIPPNPRRGRARDKGYGDESDPLYADFKANVWPRRWERYGQKPVDAFRAYAKLSDGDRVLCKAAIARCAVTIVADATNEKYRPHLSTWINKRGWEADAASAKLAVAPDWAKWVAAHKADGTWATSLGPKPGEPGCNVPREFLVEVAA